MPSTLNILKINRILIKEGNDWTQLNIPECSTRQKNRMKSKRRYESDSTETEDSSSDLLYQPIVQKTVKVSPQPLPIVKIECMPNSNVIEENCDGSFLDFADNSFFESFDGSFFDNDDDFDFGFLAN